MAIRDPLYLEVADIIVDTNRRNPKSVSHEISKRLDRMVKMRPESNQD
jgi:shikimate kinase